MPCKVCGERYADGLREIDFQIYSMYVLRIVFIAVALAGFWMYPSYASADDGEKGIAVSPMFQEVVLHQNDEGRTFSITASNTTDAFVTLRLSVVDFGSLDESGGVAFLGAQENLEKHYRIASWIRLDRDALVLGSGESQEVSVTLENRETLSPGGHYGAIIFQVERNSSDMMPYDGKPTIAISQSFASLIFAKKMGGEVYGLELKSMDVQKNTFRLPESIALRFRNTGNVHAVPRGTVAITDPLGHTVRKGIINEESSIVLPETYRSYIVRPAALMIASVPGYYTITAQYRYDGKTDATTQSIRFLYVPWFEIVAVFVSGSLFLFWLLRRKRK